MICVLNSVFVLINLSYCVFWLLRSLLCTEKPFLQGIVVAEEPFLLGVSVAEKSIVYL